MSIIVRNVTKRFGNFVAVDNVSFEVRFPGELVGLLGPSGPGGRPRSCESWPGSSAPTGARCGSRTSASTTCTPRRSAKVGFVFQHYAPFPHMTVFENVSFGLGPGPADARREGGGASTSCSA